MHVPGISRAFMLAGKFVADTRLSLRLFSTRQLDTSPWEGWKTDDL